MDMRYLNYSNAPIVSPLKKALNIDMYNDVYFQKPPVSVSTSKDAFSCHLDKLALAPHPAPNIKSAKEICKNFTRFS